MLFFDGGPRGSSEVESKKVVLDSPMVAAFAEQGVGSVCQGLSVHFVVQVDANNKALRVACVVADSIGARPFAPLVAHITVRHR